jgi:hypothetical protein
VIGARVSGDRVCKTGRVQGRVSPRAQLALALGGLAALTAIVYGAYVRDGGLYSDDWALITEIVHPAHGGWWDAVQGLWDRASYRPMSVAYYALVLKLLGTHATLHLLWSVLITLAFAALLLAVLRRVGLPLVHAFAVAALVLVTPTGDAAVLWSSAAPIRFAGALYLGGLLVALGGLGEADRGRSWRRHAGALALYVAAIWTYELTAALIAAGLLVYLAVAPPARAIRRWVADMAVAIPAMAWTLSRTPKQVQDASHQYRHAKLIVHQLWDVYGGIALPPWLPSGAAGPLTILLGVAGAAFIVAMRQGRISGPRAVVARRWIVTGAIAFVYVVAAYVVFVPADFYYSPAAVNFGNRVNGVGIAPLVLLAYAAVMVLASLVLQWRPQWLSAAVALVAVYALAMFFAHEHRLRDHMDRYVEASKLARAALADVERTVPDPPDGTLIVTTGVPALVAPDLPVFYSTWDLQGAVRARYGNPTLDAYNAFLGFQCTSPQMTVTGGPSGRYGATVIVDVQRHRSWRIASPAACRTVQKAVQAPPG